jgi:hypothetical protein
MAGVRMAGSWPFRSFSTVLVMALSEFACSAVVIQLGTRH